MSSPALVVSVALCTYNGASHLQEQLQSIFDQTRPVDEIVVGDDGSTDGTLEMLRREAARQLIPIRLLETPARLGVTRNFDRTIAACAGSFVALSDQDDLWAPTRIETQLSALEDRPATSLLFSDAELMDATGNALGYSMFNAIRFSDREKAAISGASAFSTLLRRNVVTGATTMLRKELASLCSPFPVEWVHDEWLAIVGAAAGDIDFLDSRLISYRQHEGNQIGASNPRVTHRVGRMVEHRGDRNLALAAKFTVLHSRLERLASIVPLAHRESAARKMEFESRRASMAAARWRRGVEVLVEVARGDYNRYSSQGRLDILRDLLQPA